MLGGFEAFKQVKVTAAKLWTRAIRPLCPQFRLFGPRRCYALFTTTHFS